MTKTLPRQPFDWYAPFYSFEVPVAGDDRSVCSLRQSGNEAVGITHSMQGFQSSGVESKLLVDIHNLDCELPNSPQGCMGLVYSKFSVNTIEDLSQRNGRHAKGDVTPHRTLEELTHSWSAGFYSEEREKCVAIENEPGIIFSHCSDCGGGRSRSSRSNSSRRSSRRDFVNEGPSFNIPYAAFIGSFFFGIRAIVPPYSMMCTSSPGLIPWRSRTSLGITIQPFLDTFAVALAVTIIYSSYTKSMFSITKCSCVAPDEALR